MLSLLIVLIFNGLKIASKQAKLLNENDNKNTTENNLN
jgi:hypothetical protein